MEELRKTKKQRGKSKIAKQNKEGSDKNMKKSNTYIHFSTDAFCKNTNIISRKCILFHAVMIFIQKNIQRPTQTMKKRGFETFLFINFSFCSAKLNKLQSPVSQQG